MPDAEGFPTLDELRARLSVPWQDAGDEADAGNALASAITYATDHSTILMRDRRRDPAAPVSPRVHRGTLDLAVAFYQRRGANVDPFDPTSPAPQMVHAYRQLGIGRHALPRITGASR